MAFHCLAPSLVGQFQVSRRAGSVLISSSRCKVVVSLARSQRSASKLSSSRSLVVRAFKEPNEDKKDDGKKGDAKPQGKGPLAQSPEEKKAEQTKKVMEGMKRGGIDKATANKILEVWEGSGAASPEGLRKMLRKRTLTAVAGVAVQLLLDAGAAYAAYSVGQSTALSEAFFGKIVVEFVAYFVAIYFSIGVAVDFFTLGALITASLQYQTNSEAFLAAVRNLAGKDGSVIGVGVVDKVQQAVNTIKVYQALNDINGLLKAQLGQDKKPADTLRNLAAYLTLQKAEATGFDPAEYGLSEEAAGNIALIFAQYDLNDDYRIDQSELRKLCDQYAAGLNEAEVDAAFKLLDTNKSGYIEFKEFVDWWTNKVDGSLKVNKDA